METEVIELLCDKLGIAFTSASDFMANILPQYAMMRIIDDAYWSVAWLVCIIICVVGAVFANRDMKREIKEYIDEGYSYPDTFRYKFGIGCFVAAAILFGIFFSLCVVDLLQWLICPEPMMFNKLLNKL